MGFEIFTTVGRGTDDLAGRAAHPEQRGVDPASAEIRAEDFASGLDREIIRISAEIDFPAIGSEDSILGLPFCSETWQQPETDGFVAVLRLHLEAQPCIRESAELAESGDDDGAVAACGFLRSVVGDHFWENFTCHRFLDFKREQSHAGSFVRRWKSSKP